MGEECLRVFFFTDWRIQPLQLAERMLGSVAPVDVVLYGGDDVARLTSSEVQRFPGRYETWKHLTGRCARQKALAAEERDLAKLGYWFGDPQELIEEAVRLFKRQPTRTLYPGGHVMHLNRVIELFAPEPATNWLAGLATHAALGVGAVIGNDCLPEHAYRLEKPGVSNLHRRPMRAGQWGIAGIEGAICHPSADGERRTHGIGYCLTPDERVVEHLEGASATLGVSANRLVIVSHTPPAGSLDVAIRFGFGRLGSPALAAYVDEHHPPLVLCGHCHSCGRRSVKRGSTLVVNAACSDTNAKIAPAALIELRQGCEPHLRWIDPTPHSVLYFPGIGQVRERHLQSVGIGRVPELLSAVTLLTHPRQ